MTDYISRFTPSLMKPAELEALLVQRHSLVGQIVDHVRESALSESKHHWLLVGPRGIGKTHIVSLVYHRVKAQSDLNKKLRVAWLREEEWGVASFLDFLLCILNALVAEYKEKGLQKRVNKLFEVQPRVAEALAADLLRQYTVDGTLLVLIENLDELFRGLGEDGQMRLRAFIQENPYFSFVASSPSLFAGVSLQTSPFYGFFRIRHLIGLQLEEAIELLVNIAKLQRNEKLASFIKSAIGRARIRAVHHLAGGNHRVYVVFSQFLTRTSLDELIKPFFRTLDDLTPYYQSRLHYLSTQQQKIVALLCDARHAITVKEIAQRCFITHQTASGQLKSLKDLGYVNSISIGRESYYEISEPLMRLTLEVKKHHVEPIRLFIDFLRLWYSKAELNQRLLILKPEAKNEREYVIHALKGDESAHSDPVVSACLRDCKSYLEVGEFVKALQAAEELVAVRGGADDYYEQAHCLSHLGRDEELMSVLDEAIKINKMNSRSWSLRARTLLSSEKLQDSLQALDKAIQMDANYDYAWGMRGFLLLRLERYDDALRCLDKAISLDPKFARYWLDRGRVLKAQGLFDESVLAIDKSIKLNPKSAEGLIEKAYVLGELRRFDDALRVIGKAETLRPPARGAWIMPYSRSLILLEAERPDEALKAISDAAELTPNDSAALLDIGVVMQRLGKANEAVKPFRTAVDLSPTDPHCWFHLAEALGNLGQFDEALNASNRVIELGDNSPWPFYNRAVFLIGLTRWEEAFGDLEAAFSRSKHKLEGGSEAFIIRCLFSLELADKWPSLIDELISLYRRYGILTVLGQGIVENIRLFIDPDLNPESLASWSKSWHESSKNHRQLSLPIQIFEVAVQYCRSKDEKVLLKLPAEVRAIVLSAVGDGK